MSACFETQQYQGQAHMRTLVGNVSNQIRIEPNLSVRRDDDVAFQVKDVVIE